MMKKGILLSLLLCLALSMTACTASDIGEYYQSAQLYLGCGDYGYAAELFAQLGEYEDAAEYTLYSRALQALEDDKPELARANLEAVNPFKSSGRYLMLLDAMEAEDQGRLEEALSLYEKLGTFADAHTEAERLRTDIPEAAIREGRALMAKKEYAAARDLFLSLDGYGASASLAENCTSMLNKAAYDAAEALYAAGDLQGALAAFTAMGSAMDAAERAEECKAAIWQDLEERYSTVTLAGAPELSAAYAAMADMPRAGERAAELTARYGKNLEALTMDGAHVLLGTYPYAQSGEAHQVLWRVLKAEGTVLTLLSEAVLDASAQAAPLEIVLTEKEQPGAGEVLLPSAADLALTAELQCAATPYALAQGAVLQEGGAAYWLRDCLENELHPVISADGVLTLPVAGMTAGVRPMITLDLEKFTFTHGSGTMEDPFRAK